MKNDRLISTIRKFFENIPNIVAVYLFGSAVQNGTKKPRDIDIAVLFQYPRVPDGLKLIELQGELSDLLHKSVDLVALNNASPILMMQVLKKGKCILERNRTLHMKFLVQVVARYEDLKITRRPIEDAFFSIIRGTHGR